MGSNSYNNNTNSFNNNITINNPYYGRRDSTDSDSSPAPRNATCATIGCEANVCGYSKYCSNRMFIPAVGQLVHVRR